MSETEKLLPCPFCGSTSICAAGGQVDCKRCGCGTPVDDTLDEAIVIWNTRTPGWQPRDTLPRDDTVIVQVERRDGRPFSQGVTARAFPAYVDESGRICCPGTWKPDTGLDGPHFVTTKWMHLPADVPTPQAEG